MDIRWHGPDVDDALAAHVGAGVRTGRLCPRCGSAEHGRPWARANGRDLHVSLARSGPHTVTVVADEPVGIDVESVAEVTARWHEPARTWAAKEAVLKLLGTGLDTPLDDVDLDDWVLVDLAAPEGYVAVVATGPAPKQAAPARAATRRTGR